MKQVTEPLKGANSLVRLSARLINTRTRMAAYIYTYTYIQTYTQHAFGLCSEWAWRRIPAAGASTVCSIRCEAPEDTPEARLIRYTPGRRR